MMLTRVISTAALAAITATLFTAGAADAGSRWRLHFLQPYYYSYYPRPLDLYSSDYGDDEDYDDPDDRYYEPEYSSQEDEPIYIAPKKKKTASVVPIEKPLVKRTVTSVENKKLVAPTEMKAARGTGAMTCDKAEKIVSGYGFTSIKPTSCTGQVFAFNANRSGKAYVIKLSSASGELTEVKKVQ